MAIPKTETRQYSSHAMSVVYRHSLEAAMNAIQTSTQDASENRGIITISLHRRPTPASSPSSQAALREGHRTLDMAVR
jgi:hypothetical protein